MFGPKIPSCNAFALRASRQRGEMAIRISLLTKPKKWSAPTDAVIRAINQTAAIGHMQQYADDEAVAGDE